MGSRRLRQSSQPRAVRPPRPSSFPLLGPRPVVPRKADRLCRRRIIGAVLLAPTVGAVPLATHRRRRIDKEMSF